MQMHCSVTHARFLKKAAGRACRGNLYTAMMTMDNERGAAPMGPTLLSAELFPAQPEAYLNNSKHCLVKTAARQCNANKSCRKRLPGCLKTPSIKDGTSLGQPMLEK